MVGFHLRYDLTTIHDKSCARDLHFFSHFYYFIFLMFERFDSYYVFLIIHCNIMRLISRTSCANPTSILHSSYINPVYILHLIPAYPWSDFTFGTILPRFTTSLVLSFLLHLFLDVREIHTQYALIVSSTFSTNRF